MPGCHLQQEALDLRLSEGRLHGVEEPPQSCSTYSNTRKTLRKKCTAAVNHSLLHHHYMPE